MNILNIETILCKHLPSVSVFAMKFIISYRFNIVKNC